MVCFGISSHEVEEWLPDWTPKAKHDLNILDSWFNGASIEDLFIRPAYKSTFNPHTYSNKATIRIMLGYAVIRELPIRNFYVRSFITYVYTLFFLTQGIGRGFNRRTPILFYKHQYHSRAMLNYPDLFYWNYTRILPRDPPVPNVHQQWRTRQTPVYHEYHKNVYRYKLRKPRYIPWDGSQSQPVMPYLHDQGTGVLNGTHRRLCNASPNLM